MIYIHVFFGAGWVQSSLSLPQRIIPWPPHDAIVTHLQRLVQDVDLRPATVKGGWKDGKYRYNS